MICCFKFSAQRREEASEPPCWGSMGRNETQAESYAHVTYPHMLCSLFCWFVSSFVGLMIVFFHYLVNCFCLLVCLCCLFACVVCAACLFVCLFVGWLVKLFDCLVVYLMYVFVCLVNLSLHILFIHVWCRTFPFSCNCFTSCHCLLHVIYIYIYIYIYISIYIYTHKHIHTELREFRRGMQSWEIDGFVNATSQNLSKHI